MALSGGGFEQAYNAQAAVDADTMLVVATGLSQATNDKEQIQPMLDTLDQQGFSAGIVKTLIADTGYCSAANISACQAAGIAPLTPEASVTETMAHTLKTKAGRALYKLRKQTVEPVFGIIKSVLGFRQFSLRGINKVRGEWSLVCMAWNLKRMAVLRPKTALNP